MLHCDASLAQAMSLAPLEKGFTASLLHLPPFLNLEFTGFLTHTMSPKLDSPVQTQMAISAFNGPRSGDYHGSTRSKGKSSGRRTEAGHIVGMDLDVFENHNSVKRRLQLAINFPAEELTKISMNRSSSTPCLTPPGKNSEQDQSCPTIEILGPSECSTRTNRLVKDVEIAIKNGVYPLSVQSGLGGAYYFRNIKGESIAIVKPTDEEPFAPNNPKGFVGKALGQPGLKRVVRVGETGFREVAAYLLDYGNFASVPLTILVKMEHPIFNVNDVLSGSKRKIASLQQFIPHYSDASDYGPSSFPVADVHRIGILDVRIFNTDRHGGNILVKKLDGVGRFNKVELIPIDHGLCLPECLDDPYFEWIHWPQSSIPFSDTELEHIKNLNPAQDCDMLRMELPMIRDACLRVLELCTIFLKEAAAFGLCLAEIGEMMSREYRACEEEPSELEFVCVEAMRIVSEKAILYLDSEEGNNEIHFNMDCEDGETDQLPKMATDFCCTTAHRLKFKGVNCLEGHSKLEESSDEDSIQVDCSWSPSVMKMTALMQKSALGDTSPQFHGGRPDRIHLRGKSINRKSANGQLPKSTSFVRIADTCEEEWPLFLEKFKERLYPAFVNRRSATIRQRQRLGASCQF